MVKEIELSQGKFALVDDADYDWLSQWKWYTSYYGYAVRSVWRDGDNQGLVFMHRQILDAPEGMYVDHMDGDKLNNVRPNIRLATNAQNLCNRGPNKNNTSGFKGVSWNKRSGKWRSQIWKDGVTHHLGLFADLREAASAYDKAALELHGEFAQTNGVAA